MVTEHRVVVRVCHHEVDLRASRCVGRGRHGCRVVRRVRAVGQAVLHRRAGDRRGDRDSVRQVVVGARVAAGRCRRVRGVDRQRAIDSRDIILIRHVRCAVHDLHRAERHARCVGANIGAAAGDGIPRHRYAGNVDRTRRHAARGAVVQIACAVRRDHERLVLRVGRVDRRVRGQIIGRCGVIGAEPVVVRSANRDALRRGDVIGCVACAVCHPFGADQGTVRAGAIGHLRIDGQAAVNPRDGVAFRDIHAAALEHETRLIGKARCIHAGVRAAGTRRRVLDGQPGYAGRDAGDASCAAVIVERRAVRRERQRRLRRPDRIERQVVGRHGHACARRIGGVCHARGGGGAPAEEIVARAGKRVCVHREARSHRLGCAIACVAANRTAVAVVGQAKERHARVDHDCVIRSNAAERIAVSRVGGGGQRRAVVRHAGDFITGCIGPRDGRIRAINIRARAGFG